MDDQYGHLDSGIGSTPILAKAKAGDNPATGVQWCAVLLDDTPGTAVTQYALVTGAVAAATWTGDPDFDFTICSPTGSAVLLDEIVEAGTAADDWVASTAYDAEERWSATIPAG